MRIIRAIMRQSLSTASTYVLGPFNAKAPVRILYLEQSAVPSGIPDCVLVRNVLDESGAIKRFAQFIDDRVEVGGETYKPTIGRIWYARAGMHGADSVKREILDIKRLYVPDLFMERFSEG